MDIELLKKQSELAMCVALPRSIPGINHTGRVKALVERLAKKAAKRLVQFPLYNADELKIIQDKITEFENLVKWDKNPKHLVSYVSSLACFFENRNYPEINECFVDIIDHYERGKAKKKIPSACLWSGKIAFEKWEAVWKD